jgi:hypothetical protein
MQMLTGGHIWSTDSDTEHDMDTDTSTPIKLEKTT